MTAFDPIADEIWSLKYRFLPSNGVGADATVDDTFRRVARAVAQAEREDLRATWSQAFYDLMRDFRFLPAGRILAGAGTERTVTLFNCFVMGEVEDSMGGIFGGLRESALTLQQGGGIGQDFSTIRPRGAAVKGVGADASGPLSFMDVWDSMCRTIMSAGSRRGAMMGTLRCDHPDVEAFIDAKREPGRLRNFNLSVLVTDAFMAAQQADTEWPLHFDGKTYKTVRARELWERILRATYDYAEPGVIFIDRINAANNLSYCENIRSTNPCGEQPLPPYGACLLGSLNLARFVQKPFSDRASFDMKALSHATTIAVRFMDDVIDVSRYPLPQQRAEAMSKRRIGLGVTGLADALLMCGLRYGSEAAADTASSWMEAIEQAAYGASADLAAEKGPFPLFDPARYGAKGHAAELPQNLRKRFAKDGIRNGLLTSIAPTGTISLFAGNVSSGVEPIFRASYSRKVLKPDGTRETHTVTDFAVALWRSLKGEDAALPEAFVTADDLTAQEHLVMQAALQRHVDSSISKTVNVPVHMEFEAFRAVYDEAYALGLKGCTTFRPNAITGSVMSADTQEVTPTSSQPMARAEALPGVTYKLKWPESDHAIYITINDIVDAKGRRPFEIFINSKNMEHYAWTVALTRMISAVFRRGGDVTFVVEELKAVFDPRGGQWMDGRYVPSLLAAIGAVIEQHMIAIGFLSSAEVPSADKESLDLRRASCPRCGERALVFQEGCATCLSCDFSKCS